MNSKYSFNRTMRARFGKRPRYIAPKQPVKGFSNYESH